MKKIVSLIGKVLEKLALNIKAEILNLKPKTLKLLGIVTLICILIGWVFGQVLNANLVSEQPVSVLKDVNALFIVDLGIHETYDEVLVIEGKLKKLGYDVGINLEEESYRVFSHIVDMRNLLEEVEKCLVNYDIEYEIRQFELPNGELKWDYFFRLVHQIPYEMEPDFIQEFAEDELFIWGYYVALLDSSLDALSLERQQMLREIYQWLNSRE